MTIKDWIKTHKAATAGIIFGVLIIAWIVFAMISSSARTRSKLLYEVPGSLSPSLGFESTRNVSEISVKTPSQSTVEVEVKEGTMKIKSEKAEDDADGIKSIVENYQGYVEKSSKSVTNLYVQIDLTLRVPSENFLDLVERLKKEFDIESYNVKNYRIPIGRELDEIQILKESLADYQKIREEINEMVVSKDKIELLMELTNKELELKSKERNYQNIVSSKERQGEYATLNVNLREKKSPTIWPENVLDRFKDRLRTAIDNTIEILKDLVGGIIEIFFRAIQIAIYIFIVGIVGAVFYRFGRVLFRLIIKERKPAEKA